MKVLWVVNKSTGKLHEHLTGKKATGGLWLEAMIDRARKDNDIRVVVVNIDSVNDIRILEDGNITYYTLPGKNNSDYDYKSETARKMWREVISKEKPDIIELWGTEFPYGLATLAEAAGIPSVIYVQGVLESIGKYYLAGLTDAELKYAVTLRDVLTGTTIRQEQKQYLANSAYEKKLVRTSKNIIIENKWTEAYYKKICPEVNVYRCPLSISDEYEKKRWDVNRMSRHTIMCSAANYSIKGLHQLLKALHIVKQTYPDVKLYIPGTPLRQLKTFKDKIKQRGYDKFIRSQIKALGLQDLIEYTGRLTAEEMAERMSISNCFVMCSAIENHSSTLKEAMTVGTPCIASYVGGVPEYASDDHNCLLYRFEDYEVLALDIIRLFSSDELCCQLSENARNDMISSNKNNDFYTISKQIYQDIIQRSR